MAAINGNTILIHVGNAVVGSQRGVTIDSSADMLDVSDKTSNGAKFIAGKTTDTISLSSFYVVGDVPQAALRSAYDAGTEVDVDWYEDVIVSGTPTSTQLKTAQALVSSLSVSGPDHGPAETEVTLQITGGWGS